MLLLFFFLFVCDTMFPMVWTHSHHWHQKLECFYYCLFSTTISACLFFERSLFFNHRFFFVHSLLLQLLFCSQTLRLQHNDSQLNFRVFWYYYVRRIMLLLSRVWDLSIILLLYFHTLFLLALCKSVFVFLSFAVFFLFAHIYHLTVEIHAHDNWL